MSTWFPFFLSKNTTRKPFWIKRPLGEITRVSILFPFPKLLFSALHCKRWHQPLEWETLFHLPAGGRNLMCAPPNHLHLLNANWHVNYLQRNVYSISKVIAQAWCLLFSPPSPILRSLLNLKHALYKGWTLNNEQEKDRSTCMNMIPGSSRCMEKFYQEGNELCIPACMQVVCCDHT